MWVYSEKVLEFFKNPKNVGEIENPDAVGEVGNIVCGDALKLTLKIDKKTNRIIDAKFKTFGCASAIASSSALTEMIKGKTIEEASKITNKDIADYLGGLPNEKMHCSVMGMEALERALANYLGKPIKKETIGEEKVICKCFGVTDKKIIRAIKENSLKTVEDVTNYTKAGGGCGKCKPEIEQLLKEFWAKEETKKGVLGEPKKLTNLQRINLIQETVEREIRPRLKADGGNIEIVDIDQKKVYVRFLGACLNCPAAGVTLKKVVESKLREFVEEDIIVKEVKE
ncbi:MAG TPA: Fe-S cluster assembly protein NifU [Candidatus Omnitrophica bacterium]|nr:MAG: Fe-S cluster assembly protein NifU [Candidatus Omnitrophota bacterium]RKY43379.1 MAG: Fe-S cluster assembly protein NifU [Candidatus Omnitrophota bacterium]HEC69412.1 Fe-S cluster assembly protein NifU [Candidatus Omnitrophota bacterium]